MHLALRMFMVPTTSVDPTAAMKPGTVIVSRSVIHRVSLAVDADFTTGASGQATQSEDAECNRKE